MKQEDEIKDISEDVDDIVEDIGEIGEDTDEILKRINKSLKSIQDAIKASKQNKAWIISLFLFDKAIMFVLILFALSI